MSFNIFLMQEKTHKGKAPRAQKSYEDVCSRAANDKASGRGHRGIKTVSERTEDGALGFSEGVTCMVDGMDFKADKSHQERRIKRRQD